MIIRFKINRVKLFGKRIGTISSIFLLEANPSELTNEQLELIQSHLFVDTDDNCNVVYDPERAKHEFDVVPSGGHPGADLIEAKEPTLESLLEALTELESQTDFSPRTTRNTRTEFLSCGSGSSRLQLPT